MFVDYYIYVSLHICKCPLTIVNGMSRIEVILHNTLIDAIYVAGGLRGRWTTGHMLCIQSAVQICRCCCLAV